MKWTIYNADFSENNIGGLNDKVTWYKYSVSNLSFPWKLVSPDLPSSSDKVAESGGINTRLSFDLEPSSFCSTWAYHVADGFTKDEIHISSAMSLSEINNLLSSKFIICPIQSSDVMLYTIWYIKEVHECIFDDNNNRGILIGKSDIQNIITPYDEEDNILPTWDINKFISSVELPIDVLPIVGFTPYVSQDRSECIKYENGEYYYYTTNYIDTDVKEYWKKYNYSYQDSYIEHEGNVGSYDSYLLYTGTQASLARYDNYNFTYADGYSLTSPQYLNIDFNSDTAASQLQSFYLSSANYYLSPSQSNTVCLITNVYFTQEQSAIVIHFEGTVVGSCYNAKIGQQGSYIGIVQSTLGSLPEEGEVITSSENHYILLIDGSYYEYIKAEASSMVYWKKYAFDWDRDNIPGERLQYLGLIQSLQDTQPEPGTILYQESNNRYIIRNEDGNEYDYVLINEDDLVVWKQYEYSITESGWHVTNIYNGDMVTMEYRAYNQDEFGYFRITPGIHSKWEREPAGPIILTGVLKFHKGYIDDLDSADITSSFAPGYFLTTLSDSPVYSREAVASVRSVSTSIQTDSQGKPYVYVQIVGEIEKTAIYTVGGEDQGPYIQDVAAPVGEVPNPNYGLYRGDPATDDEIIMQDNYSGEYYQFLRKGSNYNPDLGSDGCFYHSEEIDLFYAGGDIIVRDNIYASYGYLNISSYEGNVTWIDENDTGITQSATSEIFYDENSDTWSSSHTLFSGIYPALDTSVNVELTYTVMDGGTYTIYASFMNSYQ